MIKIINSILKILNLKLINASQHKNGLNYISAKETVNAAKGDGLSVCDYVEREWNQVGETQKVIDNMEKVGAFVFENPAVCEIGAGTGRYMEKVIENCNPSLYESYETALDWAEWLQKKYPIISRPSDGHLLKDTEDNSIDLVHAHGVFVYIPFFDSLKYFKEIDRIAKQNSVIVFDCITEECLDKKSLSSWLDSEYNYPMIFPEEFILQYFPNNKYNLVDVFFTQYGRGKSKYYVFKKN